MRNRPDITLISTYGGMVNTYVDSTTNTPYDYGVEAFLDIGNATNFFQRFGIELGPLTQAKVTTEYIDFDTGALVNITLASLDAQGAALEKFLNIVEPWAEYVQPGYWDLLQPADIPADFLIPYGDFITKYGLEDAVPVIYETTGLGCILSSRTNAYACYT